MMTSIGVSTVRQLLLDGESRLGSTCTDVVRSVIPDGLEREVDVGFPMAFQLLEIYRYRREGIEGFRASKHGWETFFSVLEGTDGRIGLLAIRYSGWRFTVLVDEDLSKACACLYGPPLL
jgi:hypothetical protein